MINIADQTGQEPGKQNPPTHVVEQTAKHDRIENDTQSSPREFCRRFRVEFQRFRTRVETWPTMFAQGFQQKAHKRGQQKWADILKNNDTQIVINSDNLPGEKEIN